MGKVYRYAQKGQGGVECDELPGLKLSPEDDEALFYEEPGIKGSKPVSLRRTGRKINPETEARNRKRVYVEVEGEDVYELEPTPSVMGSEGRLGAGGIISTDRQVRSLVREVGHEIPDLSDFSEVLIDTINAGDESILLHDIEEGSIDRVKRLSENIAFFYLGSPATKLKKGTARQAKEKLWQWDQRALSRLGGLLNTQCIDSDVVKGLIVRGEPLFIVNPSALGGRGAGVSKQEADSLFIEKRGLMAETQFALALSQEFGKRLQHARDNRNPIGVREFREAEKNCAQVARFYSRKWGNVFEVWDSSNCVDSDFLKHFSAVSDALVVQPWTAQLHYERREDMQRFTDFMSSKWWLGENSRRALVPVTMQLKRGFDKGLDAGEVAAQLDEDLPGVIDAVQRDKSNHQIEYEKAVEDLADLQQESAQDKEIIRARGRVGRSKEIVANCTLLAPALKKMLSDTFLAGRLCRAWYMDA